MAFHWGPDPDACLVAVLDGLEGAMEAVLKGGVTIFEVASALELGRESCFTGNGAKSTKGGSRGGLT